MSIVENALGQALAEAAESNEELRRRAQMAVDGLQRYVVQDGGKKVMRAGAALMVGLNAFGAEHKLTPGELALVLAASMHNVLGALPGMTPELARAIAVELAGGPRSE